MLLSDGWLLAGIVTACCVTRSDVLNGCLAGWLAVRAACVDESLSHLFPAVQITLSSLCLSV